MMAGDRQKTLSLIEDKQAKQRGFEGALQRDATDEILDLVFTWRSARAAEARKRLGVICDRRP